MDNDEIFEKVRVIIVGCLNIDPSEVTRDALLEDDLGADGIALVEIIMEVEEEFSIQIPDVDVEGFNVVADIIDFVEDNM